jgi:tetratricopeptide (TPR) repeat protein
MRLARCVVVLFYLSSAFASAEEAHDLEYAKKMFKEGLAHYNLREYKEALIAFEASYRAEPDPVFLFNIAQAYRQLGKPADAVRFYKLFLKEVPNSPYRPMVENILASIEPKPAAREPARLATPAAQPPVPSETRVELRARPASRPWYKSAAGWTLTGIAVAAIATGAGLAAHGHELATDAPSAMNLSQFRDMRDQGSTFQTAGYSVLGIGAAAVVAGVVVFVFNSRRGDRPRPSIGVRSTSNGVFAELRGEW